MEAFTLAKQIGIKVKGEGQDYSKSVNELLDLLCLGWKRKLFSGMKYDI